MVGWGGDFPILDFESTLNWDLEFGLRLVKIFNFSIDCRWAPASPTGTTPARSAAPAPASDSPDHVHQKSGIIEGLCL